jgi:cell division protein FtsQ
MRHRLRGLARLAARIGLATGVAWSAMAGLERAYVFATTSPRFQVQHLIYEPTAHVDEDRLRALLGLARGTNILAVDVAELAEKVAADPWVARATVVRELPDALRVDVVEHQPAAALLAGHVYLVDAEARPFKRAEPGERGQLPLITGLPRSLLVEDLGRASAEISRALEVLEGYRRKQRPRLSEIHLDEDGSVTLYTAQAGSQYRLGRGEIESKLLRLDALRAALGERAEALAVVHLDAAHGHGERERVFASFFANTEVPTSLLSAQRLHDAAARADQDTHLPTPERASGAKRASRLPRAQ